jgi:iron(III) transport system ATP-binding protein
LSSVAVRGVRKSFGGHVVLDDVDLDVGDGRTTVLLGPSGCGKTTLLRLIAGLDPVDAGTVQVGDRVVSGPGVHVVPERRGIGLVFQDGALFPHMSVGRNIGYGLERAQRRSGPRIDELAELVGLAGATNRAPDQLSGGEQQRVALARALGPEPDVLLLDEPFSNLDAVLRERLRDQVRAIVSDAAGQSNGAVVSTEIGRLTVAQGGAAGPVEVLARPEDLALVTADSAHEAAGSPALVEACQAEGSTWVATVRLSSGSQARSRGLGPCPWIVGDHVSIRVEAPVWTVLEGSREEGRPDGSRASVP